MAETQLIPIHLTLREIAFISDLRKLPFGVIEVHMKDGVIQRTITKQSKMLTDRDGIIAMKREQHSSIAIGGKTGMIEE